MYMTWSDICSDKETINYVPCPIHGILDFFSHAYYDAGPKSKLKCFKILTNFRLAEIESLNLDIKFLNSELFNDNSLVTTQGTKHLAQFSIEKSEKNSK